jgi:hypothetical protein
MSDGRTSGQLLRLSKAARAASRRQRINAAVRRLVLLLPVPLGYAALGLALGKWLEPGPTVTRLLAGGFLVACLVPVVGVVACWLARRSTHAGALALDRHHQSADRITNALEFARLPPATQSPFMQAAISDALLAVERPNASAAVPLELPRGAGWSVALVLAVVAVSFIKPQPPAPPVHAPALLPSEPVVLGADDLSFLRESVREFQPAEGSPELTQAVTEFNRLVEDMAERRLDRRELFRRLADIERALDAGPEADEALEAGLQNLAEQLEKSPLSRPIAEAVKAKQLADAERAMRELAERLARKDEKVDPAELERLRKALEAASSEADGRVERLEQMRRDVESEQRRLLQKKNAKQDKPEAEQRAEQERQKRRLEKLDRDIHEAKQSQEKMSELDKELAKAAQDLMKEMGKSAEHLNSGAEDMNRMARQKMSDKQKQELKQKLEELRDLLRQGGAGREEHMKRLQQFAERARGSKGEGSGEGQSGKQGQPGQQGPPRLTLGPGGTPLPMPGAGSPGPGGERPGSGDGQSGGTEAGSGSSPEMKGPATDLQGKTEDVTAAAVDTGQGAASSEVVFGAAERGFTGARYQKVYTQYRTVAEDVLQQDTIPAGYEFYVRRYFQLIRPRQAQDE